MGLLAAAYRIDIRTRLNEKSTNLGPFYSVLVLLLAIVEAKLLFQGHLHVVDSFHTRHEL